MSFCVNSYQAHPANLQSSHGLEDVQKHSYSQSAENCVELELNPCTHNNRE